MTYQISGEPEPGPCSEMEGAFQRALCEEMEEMRQAILRQIEQPYVFLRLLEDPVYRARAEALKAAERQRKIEKWGERRVNARGIGLRIARTWNGPKLTILPEEETDPW